MKLNVADRLTALALLPPQGDIVTLRLVQDAKTLLGLTPIEIDLWGVQVDQEKGTARWSPEADTVREIELSGAIHGLLADRLRELNDKRELAQNHMPLWEKLVEVVPDTEEETEVDA